MNGSMYLTTENPDDAFNDLTALSACLNDIGLTGEKISDFFLCGSQFAQLITFMGCSPHLVMTPPDDGSENFCHIRLLQFDQPKLLTGQQTAPPRCPACRFRISDWENTLKPDDVNDWDCPKCRQQTPVAHLDWRQSAGAGKILIEIKNIFPGEAVPVDKLLAALKNLSGNNWKYFYIA